MTRSRDHGADALARKALAFDLSVRDRRDLERKAAALDRLAEWLQGAPRAGSDRVTVEEILRVLEGRV